MNSLMRMIAGLGAFSLLSTVPAPADPAPPSEIAAPPPAYLDQIRERIVKVVRKEMRQHDVVGLSIALVDDQRIVWAEGFGHADKEHDVPATAATVYRAGSLAKLFTVTAALQLVEEGKMDLDAPLRKYLPQFSVKSRFHDAGPITIRSIMTHHSGLTGDHAKGMWTKNPEPFTAVVDRIHDTYAAYPPDFVFSYSNLGMTLLGHAIERTSGREFAAFMQDAVLGPLNMRDSSFSAACSSKGYRKEKGSYELPLRDVPAGGLNSTVLDLGRFIRMIFAGGKSGGKHVLAQKSVAEMLRPQNEHIPLDLDLRVGLGWMLSGLGKIDIRNAGPVAHHAGGTLLFHSMMIILPERKLGVVVLANSAESGGAVSEVAAAALRLMLEEKTGISRPEAEILADDRDAFTHAELDAYPGRYATILGLADVTRKSDSLRVEALGRTFSLLPRSDGRLRLRYRLFGFIPISLGEIDRIGLARVKVSGRDVLAARWGGRDMLVGEKIAPAPVPDAWKQRASEYEFVNRGSDALLAENVRLAVEDGLLVVHYRMPLFTDAPIAMALLPVSATEAVSPGLGRGMGETIRAVVVNGEELLEYSGYLLRKKSD